MSEKSLPAVPLATIVETALNKSVIHFAASIYAKYGTREQMEKVYYACRDNSNRSSLAEKCPEIKLLLSPNNPKIAENPIKVALKEEITPKPVVEATTVNNIVLETVFTEPLEITESAKKILTPSKLEEAVKDITFSGANEENTKHLVEKPKESPAVVTEGVYSLDDLFTKDIPEFKNKYQKIHYLMTTGGLTLDFIAAECHGKGYIPKSESKSGLNYKLRTKGFIV